MDNYSYVTPDINYVLSEPEREKGVGAYRFLGILFFLLAVGGLFLGILGKFVSAFVHSPALIGIPENIFDYSLCGRIIAIFKNFSAVLESLKATFSISISGGIWVALSYLFPLLAGIAAVLSLFLMIATLVAKKKKTAQNAAFCSGILTLIAYGGIFLFIFIASSAEAESINSALFDIPSSVIAGVVLLALAAATFARSKGQGVLNTAMLLLVAVAVCAVAYPGTALSQYNFLAFDLKEVSIFLGIAMPALFVMLVFNLIVSCIRLNAARHFVFDIIRYAALFLATLLTLIAFIATPVAENDRWMIFKSPQLLPTVVLIVATLIPLLVSIFTTAISSVKRRNEDFQRQAMQSTIGPEENDSYEDTPPTNVVVTLDAGMLMGRKQEDRKDERDENVYEPRPEPVPLPFPEPRPAPMVAEPAEPAPELHVPESVTPAPEPVVVKEVIREVIREPFEPADRREYRPVEEPSEEKTYREPEELPKKKKALSEFEIRMAELARGEATAAKAANTTRYSAPVHNENELPTRPAREKSRPETPASYGYNGMQYTYDPFINTLTPSEKNEFGDVFIANMYGIHSYLPTYVIGGDNREFFQKVFIYLGRYRGYITQDLMEKIYAYVNKTS